MESLVYVKIELEILGPGRSSHVKNERWNHDERIIIGSGDILSTIQIRFIRRVSIFFFLKFFDSEC